MNTILVAIAAASLVAGGTAAPSPRSQVVEIDAGEFAFTVPSGIHAGPATFRFVNRGKLRHELSIALLRPGATLQQYMTARQAKAHADQLLDASVGVLLAPGGSRDQATLSTTLLAGRDYLVICDLKDSVAAPIHSTLGMFTSIHVADGADAPVRAVHADTIVASDYAFRLPATLPAGHHAFAFVNSGTQRHELKLFALPRGQTLKAFMEEHAAIRAQRARGGSATNAALGVLLAGPGISPLGTLDIDLEAGREYAFICDFADTPSAPAHSTLGMFGSIRVTRRR